MQKKNKKHIDTETHMCFYTQKTKKNPPKITNHNCTQKTCKAERINLKKVIELIFCFPSTTEHGVCL